MPLMIEHCDGLCCPIVVCDWCGERIASAADGNYQWDASDPSGSRFPIVFTHKRCCHAFEEANRWLWGRSNRLWMAAELAALPHYLLVNLGLTVAQSRQAAAMEEVA